MPRALAPLPRAGLVFSTVKRALFERVLADSHTGNDADMQKHKDPTVTRAHRDADGI